MTNIGAVIVRAVRYCCGLPKALLGCIDTLVEQHKAIRRLLVVWATLLISGVTYEVLMVLRKMSEITAPVVSFYLGVTALLTAVIGFYQWQRQQDDKGKPDAGE